MHDQTGPPRHQDRPAQSADFLPSVRAQLGYLAKHGAAGEARRYAEGLVAQAITWRDRLTLSLVSAILRESGGGRTGGCSVAVAEAEAEVRLTGGTNAQALLNLASTCSAAGDAARAGEYARKAVAAAAGEPAAMREAIEREEVRLGDRKPAPAPPPRPRTSRGSTRLPTPQGSRRS